MTHQTDSAEISPTITGQDFCGTWKVLAGAPPESGEGDHGEPETWLVAIRLDNSVPEGRFGIWYARATDPPGEPVWQPPRQWLRFREETGSLETEGSDQPEQRSISYWRRPNGKSYLYAMYERLPEGEGSGECLPWETFRSNGETEYGLWGAEEGTDL